MFNADIIDTLQRASQDAAVLNVMLDKFLNNTPAISGRDEALANGLAEHMQLLICSIRDGFSECLSMIGEVE